MSRNQSYQEKKEDNTHSGVFDSKSDESLTEIYDRFVKLLNDLSLVDNEYVVEDSNLKFLLALPEKWYLKTTTIRDNNELGEMDLDEIYGMLKTHELDMEQRSKRHWKKSRSVSLKVEVETEKKVSNKKKACLHKITQEYVVTSNIESELSSFPQRLVYS